jgi:Fic family protein
LAGYRNDQVFIKGALHVPVSKEAVRDCMPVLFELLEQEEHAAVRAVLGHFVFVYIHPYMDGNGRLARFLMNLMLSSGGYAWTVIPVEQRPAYMEALEQASSFNNIEPFARFSSRLAAEQTERPLPRPR